ncbi:MAG: Hsp70 family protein [Acidobacteria bacterium]|nr:MAG: Hsp70 family protein [Acidobacteriota bacterium]
MPRAFGLDFGTTNSAVACASEAGVETTSIHRSVLYFEPKAATASGNEAIDRYLAADEKGRLIQSLKSFLASRLFTGTNVYGRQYSIEDLLTIFLRHLRAIAEQQFGPLQGTIVVGRPVRYANANNNEDSEFALGRLRTALEKAGIGPVEFEYEPVAAAYFYASTLDHDELIVIGDFGGGTSDFSLLRVGPRERSVLGTEGVALAGDAFDSRMVRHLVSPMLGRGSEYRSLEKTLPMPVWVYSDLERWHYLSLLKSSDTIQMLRSIRYHSIEPEKLDALLHVVQNDLGFYLHRSIQTTKSELSSKDESLFQFNDAVVQIEAPLARTRFEEWIDEELTNIRECADRLLADAGVSPADVDHVFLTGGSSLVPAVRRIFESIFGVEKLTGGSEFTSVAQGLALQALDRGGV